MPSPISLVVQPVPGKFAVCRLESDTAVPSWATVGCFWSVTRTLDEQSVVVAEENVPIEVPAERGFVLLQVVGPLDFSLTGILASLLNPLTEAGISVFTLSTFDTDYLLIRQERLAEAIAALQAVGHRVNS